MKLHGKVVRESTHASPSSEEKKRKEKKKKKKREEKRKKKEKWVELKIKRKTRESLSGRGGWA